jgi:hypothetical protein
MRIKSFRILAIVAIFGGLTLLQTVAPAQRPASPVEVTNTTANPVPVTGGVAITNSPTVDARQSGQWNVGISGTPTVQLDPAANIVRVARAKSYQRAEETIWTGQASDAWTTNGTDLFDKISVCVAHSAPNAIQVNVFSLVVDSAGGSSFFFTRDRFVIGSPDTVCKLYDLLGGSTQVQVLNTGNNNTGMTRVGIVGR